MADDLTAWRALADVACVDGALREWNHFEWDSDATASAAASLGEEVRATVNELRAALLAACDRIEALEGALRVYANEENWRNDDWGVLAIINAENEYGQPGQVARRALASPARGDPTGEGM